MFRAVKETEVPESKEEKETSPLDEFTYEGSEPIKTEEPEDTVSGGEGEDTVEAEDDTVEGGEGEDTVEAEGDDTAEGGEGDDTLEAEGEEEKPKAKKKKSVEERIADITKARREEERRANAASEALAEKEAENERLRTLLKDSGKKELTGDKESSTSELKAPDPQDFEYGELDEKYRVARDQYLEDKITAKFEAQQKEQRQQEAAEQQVSELTKKRDEQLVKGVTKYEDFEDVVLNNQDLNNIDAPAPETAKLILESEHGADILYHLGKNADVAKDMASKSPFEQARFIGKLESQFSSEKDTKTPKAKAPKARQATPTVKGSAGKGGAISDDTNDFGAFFEKYNDRI